MVYKNSAFIRAKKAADALHKDGLAGAVVSNDAVDLAFSKVWDTFFNAFSAPKDLLTFRTSMQLSTLSLRSCEGELVAFSCLNGGNVKNNYQGKENEVGLPEPRQFVIAEVVHMIGGLI